MSSFYKPTKYNGQTKNQMWMSIIADAHDIHCECTEPFCHILDSIFPEGHKDRNLTIEQIIQRGKQKCPSGGEEEEDHGLLAGQSAATPGEPIKEERDDLDDAQLAELLAAAEEDDTR